MRNIGQFDQIGHIKIEAEIIGAAKGIRALSRIFAGPVKSVQSPRIAETSTKKINSWNVTTPIIKPITPASFTSPIPIFSFEAIAKTQKNSKNSTPPTIESKMRLSIKAMTQSNSEQ